MKVDGTLPEIVIGGNGVFKTCLVKIVIGSQQVVLTSSRTKCVGSHKGPLFPAIVFIRASLMSNCGVVTDGGNFCVGVHNPCRMVAYLHIFCAM